MRLPYQRVFFLHDWSLTWKLPFTLAPAVAPGRCTCPGRSRAALAPGQLSGGCLATLGLRSQCSAAEVRVPAAPAGQWLHWEIAGGQRRCFQEWFYMHTCDLCLKWLYGKRPSPEALLSNAAVWGACLICSFFPFLFYFFATDASGEVMCR